MEKILVFILIITSLLTNSNSDNILEAEKIEEVQEEIIFAEEKMVDVQEEAVNEMNEISSRSKRDLSQFEGKKLLAFTFDDGPYTSTTGKLLDNLDKYNARVTFFVVGSRINTYKDTLLRAYEQGNQIGSHTYGHSNLLKLNLSDVKNDIDKTNTLIEDVIREKPILIRPPYGNTNNDIRDLTDMSTILWDVDTLDWKTKNAKSVKEHIISHAHDGAIILLHDIYMTSIDGALGAMEELQKEGYAFVTIDEMAELKGIKLDNTKNYYNIK